MREFPSLLFRRANRTSGQNRRVVRGCGTKQHHRERAKSTHPDDSAAGMLRCFTLLVSDGVLLLCSYHVLDPTCHLSSHPNRSSPLLAFALSPSHLIHTLTMLAHPRPFLQLAHQGVLLRVLPRDAEGVHAGVVQRRVVELLRRRVAQLVRRPVGKLVQRPVRQQLPRLTRRQRRGVGCGAFETAALSVENKRRWRAVVANADYSSGSGQAAVTRNNYCMPRNNNKAVNWKRAWPSTAEMAIVLYIRSTAETGVQARWSPV